jgi:hypothetical protein
MCGSDRSRNASDGDDEEDDTVLQPLRDRDELRHSDACVQQQHREWQAFRDRQREMHELLLRMVRELYEVVLAEGREIHQLRLKEQLEEYERQLRVELERRAFLEARLQELRARRRLQEQAAQQQQQKTQHHHQPPAYSNVASHEAGEAKTAHGGERCPQQRPLTVAVAVM